MIWFWRNNVHIFATFAGIPSRSRPGLRTPTPFKAAAEHSSLFGPRLPRRPIPERDQKCPPTCVEKMTLEIQRMPEWSWTACVKSSTFMPERVSSLSMTVAVKEPFEPMVATWKDDGSASKATFARTKFQCTSNGWHIKSRNEYSTVLPTGFTEVIICVFAARSTIFDAENVFRLLSVGVPRSMEENVPQKNHFRLLSDNRQRGL